MSQQSNSFPAPIFPAIDASTLQVLGLDLDAKVPQATPFLFNDAVLADASADSALSSQATNSQETRPRKPRNQKSEREKHYDVTRAQTSHVNRANFFHDRNSFAISSLAHSIRL